ncbi:adenosylcobinamide-GDP ribazoletransferase [Thiohalorhabdus methylotrophus]|uniref:Adenosylcobinamide-GDP ribazoletransferase n=1 Tax=Thiohalorhabdus methylotrophus TaxID=3242694 RepID=A0ABV4TYZ2_9GAMM
MLPPLVALADLTRIPVPRTSRAGAADHARAVPWYPAAGLVIGVLLVTTAFLLQGLPVFLVAIAVTGLWIGLTGARHLQGLADTADGFIGGYGNRRRILRIMRDRQGGMGALAAVILVVLAKAFAVGCLLHHQQWASLLAAPVAGRVLLGGILATTPHVPDDPGDLPLFPHLDRAAVMAGILAGALLLGAAMTGGLAALAVLAVLAGLLRWASKQALGGFNSDILDTACELGELAALGAALWGAGACL